MKQVSFKNAYFIKLGGKGIWEKSSIEGNKVRIGWARQSLDDINDHKWDIIREQLQDSHSHKSMINKGAVTRDLNSLKHFAESTIEDVWITFYESYLWWCKIDGPVLSDDVSKYRRTSGTWYNRDIDDNILIINQISGRLSKIQRFQGTICKVRDTESLLRLINHKPSKEHQEITTAKNTLIERVKAGLKRLHWRDFETLSDLLFSNAGWRRLSIVGKSMKYVDMEYEDPITQELYQVQVKSTAGLSDLYIYRAVI